MQQYSQMLSGRNPQQSSMSLSGSLPVGVDRSVRMLPGAGGMGMMPGVNRGIPLPRPSFQGISSPGMLNMVSTGSMLSSGGQGVQNSVNVHPSAICSPGNSMMRPRDPLQMLRVSFVTTCISLLLHNFGVVFCVSAYYKYLNKLFIGIQLFSQQELRF